MVWLALYLLEDFRGLLSAGSVPSFERSQRSLPPFVPVCMCECSRARVRGNAMVEDGAYACRVPCAVCRTQVCKHAASWVHVRVPSSRRVAAVRAAFPRRLTRTHAHAHIVQTWCQNLAPVRAHTHAYARIHARTHAYTRTPSLSHRDPNRQGAMQRS